LVGIVAFYYSRGGKSIPKASYPGPAASRYFLLGLK
jgi:hypothetical protein